MKYLVSLAILAASTFSAFAQQPVAQPEFVPIVIDKPKLDQFLAWLNEQPGRFSVPMTDFLRAWEQSSVMAEEARKAEEIKKAGDQK